MSILLCKRCKHQQIVGRSERIHLLRTNGKLLRDKDPSPDIVDALFENLISQIQCAACGATGLEERAESTDETDPEIWGESRRCIGCGVAIPAERLELLPKTQQCTPCAAAGKTSREDQRQFCDRCGGLVVLTARRGSGLAGYTMACSSCGQRH